MSRLRYFSLRSEIRRLSAERDGGLPTESALSALLRTALAVKLDALTDQTLDSFSRLASALLAAIDKTVNKRCGLRVRYWDENGPSLPPSHLTEHRYVLAERMGKRYYIYEPYSLSSSELQQFIKLIEAGWNFEITGKSSYFPGRTLRILCWK